MSIVDLKISDETQFPVLRLYSGLQPVNADAKLKRNKLLSEIYLTKNNGRW